MKKKTKYILYTISAILTAGAGYALYKKYTEQKENSEEDQWKDRNYIKIKKHD